MNHKAYIINLKRSAVAKYGGKLTSMPAPDIASIVIEDTLSPLKKIKKKIDEVILGNVLSAGLGLNPARIAASKAGISIKTPSLTINKVCASGLKSVILASQAIQTNDADCIIAGGMESMSRCPFLLENYRFGIRHGHQVLKDGIIHDGLFCSLIGKHMGVTAENIAKKFKISREEQDRFALKSHQKAIKAIDNKKFKKEIFPIKIKTTKDTFLFTEDEQPRRDTTLSLLKKLKPVFKKNGTVTAGNSSSLNDAAAAVLLASEKLVKKHSLKPMALIKNYASIGLDPNYMGLGSYYASKKCLKKAGIALDEVDLWEINEAFACQSIAVIRLLEINPDIVNVNGGAIALGHPIGASGARILTTLIYELKRRKLRFGVAALCVGGGQGVAMLIENI